MTFITANISRLILHRALSLLIFLVLSSGCASNLQTKVAGNLNSLSKNQTVAILPIEVSHSGQQEMAHMFRQGLYANLKQSKFNLLEKYIVDGLLKQNDLTDPSGFLVINPMQFGEILGADAIVFSRINKVERNYLIIHSSIELSVSIQMVDTRTGEILWRAEQTEHDFSGIGKIPTGISTALFAPIQFVTNKLNLSKMTSKMVDKLTALIKKPENAVPNTQFDDLLIAKKATNDLNKIKELQQLKSEWAQALTLDEEAVVLQNDATEEAPKEVATLDNNLVPTAPEIATEPKNRMAVKAVVHKVHDVETEMSPLTDTPKAIEQKVETPIPLNALRATLVAPNHVGSPGKSNRDKTKPSEKFSKNSTQPKKFYTVQVGAYKTKAYAQSLLGKLTKKGYNAFMTQSDKLVYRVQVDKFNTKEDALKLAQGIREKENLKNFITLIQPG
jgi:cell division protein FtsN